MSERQEAGRHGIDGRGIDGCRIDRDRGRHDQRPYFNEAWLQDEGFDIAPWSRNLRAFPERGIRSASQQQLQFDRGR